MAEVSLAYVFTGPDGTRAVLGNGPTATADPDWCGYLDPENGITGLLDGADVRESATELVEGDGATHGAFYLGRRSGTVQGTLLPGQEMPEVNAARSKLKRATRALRADGVMRWTPSGDSIERELRFRRQQRFSESGRRPKNFQFALVSANSFVYSASELTQVIVPGGAAGELGISNPITDPITSPLDVTAQQFVINEGDAPSWPRFRIDGPITNPELLSQTTGQRFKLNYTLAAGEYLDVISEHGQILLAGSADRYYALDFPVSEWWQLQPGSNDIRLLATAYSTGAQVTVRWRHAYE